jgi:hypothetical protein
MEVLPSSGEVLRWRGKQIEACYGDNFTFTFIMPLSDQTQLGCVYTIRIKCCHHLLHYFLSYHSYSVFYGTIFSKIWKYHYIQFMISRFICRRVDLLCGLVVKSSWLQIGDVLCFLWGTNWIYIYYAEESRPPLWSSGRSSWLQIGDALCFLWGTNWISIHVMQKKIDRLCGLVVRVPGYRSECIVLPVRYELNLYTLCRRK